jgi:catechol 2,3-dioxygenase-like lactoylglutathione lyase family enzyme
MLGDKDAAAVLAVSDLQRARSFYENTLGFEAVQEPPGAILYRSGHSVLLVYPSEYAGTNKATAVTWALGDDFGATVQALKDKGVAFEHYDDLPETTRDGDVHQMGDLKAVWFKDPDGNILSLVNQATM